MQDYAGGVDDSMNPSGNLLLMARRQHAFRSFQQAVAVGSVNISSENLCAQLIDHFTRDARGLIGPECCSE
jgi:hypothetical protein